MKLKKLLVLTLLSKLYSLDIQEKEVVFKPDDALFNLMPYENQILLENEAIKQMTPLSALSNKKINSLDYNLDGSLCVIGLEDKKAILFSPKNNTTVFTFPSFSEKITAVKFNPNNKNLVIGTWDGKITLFDIATFKKSGGFQSYQWPINSLDFSSDHEIVGAHYAHGKIALWDIKTNTLIDPPDNLTSLNVFTFHPCTLLLATGQKDGTIQFWDITKKLLFKRFKKKHTNSVTSLQLSHDGSLLASCSNDQTLKIWQTETGDLIKTIALNNPVIKRSINFFGPTNNLLIFLTDKKLHFFYIKKKIDSVIQCNEKVITLATSQAQLAALIVSQNNVYSLKKV